MDTLISKQISTSKLPEIVILSSSASFLKRYDKELSSKFRILRPAETEIPLEQFLTTKAQNTLAAVCSAGFKISADVLRYLPCLRMIFTTSDGLNHIDLCECRKRGISLANSPSIFTADVADVAVAMIIDVMRKISAGNRFVKTGLWPELGDFPLGSKVHQYITDHTTSDTSVT